MVMGTQSMCLGTPLFGCQLCIYFGSSENNTPGPHLTARYHSNMVAERVLAFKEMSRPAHLCPWPKAAVYHRRVLRQWRLLRRGVLYVNQARLEQEKRFGKKQCRCLPTRAHPQRSVLEVKDPNVHLKQQHRQKEPLQTFES